MKAILFFILVLFSLISQTQDKEAVAKIIETQRLAWNRGDIEAYMQGYWKSDSLTFVGKTGPVYGWKKNTRTLQKSLSRKSRHGAAHVQYLTA